MVLSRRWIAGLAGIILVCAGCSPEEKAGAFQPVLTSPSPTSAPSPTATTPGPLSNAVTNKRSTDALIVVSTAGKTQASMYLRAKSTATLTGLRGSLGIGIRTGSDWDGAGRGFTRGCEEETFNEPLDRGYDWSFDI